MEEMFSEHQIISEGHVTLKSGEKFSFAIKYFTIIMFKYIYILNCNNIWQYYSFYCIWNQINAAYRHQKHQILKNIKLKNQKFSDPKHLCESPKN